MRYLIVNPNGVIHAVTREMAADILKNNSNFHLATPEEIERYDACGGIQNERKHPGMTADEYELYMKSQKTETPIIDPVKTIRKRK